MEWDETWNCHSLPVQNVTLIGFEPCKLKVWIEKVTVLQKRFINNAKLTTQKRQWSCANHVFSKRQAEQAAPTSQVHGDNFQNLPSKPVREDFPREDLPHRFLWLLGKPCQELLDGLQPNVRMMCRGKPCTNILRKSITQLLYFVWSPPWHLSICYWQIFWHSIWHIFWHFIWHIFWHSIWHLFWHSIWHLIWHFLWHTFWHSIWHIF